MNKLYFVYIKDKRKINMNDGYPCLYLSVLINDESPTDNIDLICKNYISKIYGNEIEYECIIDEINDYKLKNIYEITKYVYTKNILYYDKSQWKLLSNEFSQLNCENYINENIVYKVLYLKENNNTNIIDRRYKELILPNLDTFRKILFYVPKNRFEIMPIEYNSENDIEFFIESFMNNKSNNKLVIICDFNLGFDITLKIKELTKKIADPISILYASRDCKELYDISKYGDNIEFKRVI